MPKSTSERAAQTWWEQSAPGPRDPGARGTFYAPVRRPSTYSTFVLALCGLLFTPCALFALLSATSQLRRADRLGLDADARHWLHAARVLAIVITLLAVTIVLLAILTRT